MLENIAKTQIPKTPTITNLISYKDEIKNEQTKKKKRTKKTTRD